MIETGFYEAIGGAMGLAVATPAHLQSLGYLSSTVPDNEDSKRFEDLPDLPKGMTAQDMNYLLSQALDKVTRVFELDCKRTLTQVFDCRLLLSHSLIRWISGGGLSTTEAKILIISTASGGRWDTSSKVSNHPRTEHMRISMPVPSSRSRLMLNTSSNVYKPFRFLKAHKLRFEMLLTVSRYFVGSFLQFQFYKSMCDEADDKPDLLFKCDFSGNHKVGDKMR